MKNIDLFSQIDIPHFQRARVLVVGDVMLDSYWRGDTSRISPEAPVPVVKIEQFEDRVGGAANVALNARALGCEVNLLGIVGQDAAADTLATMLQSAGVSQHFCRISDIPTIKKLRVISHNNQLIRLDFESGFGDCDFTELLNIYKSQISQADIVVLSDYGKGTLGCVRDLIAIARQHAIPVLVDPKSRDFSIYDGASIITPNSHEFEVVVGHCKTEEEFAERALQLIVKHQLDALLITRGAHGMTLAQKNGDILHIPTRAREVFDVTGAGDTVIATLAGALATGMELESATVLANAAAGIAVRKLGTAVVTNAELRRAMQRLNDAGVGIMDEDELLLYVKDAKAHGEKIVVTNGCFDILHAGHVAYLERARALGNRLIVAVNDDASVQRLKGMSRPINSLEQRMLVLASLRSVDWVVPFSEDTPERLIQAISPDILAKGGDYTVEQIAGAQHVLASGGKVEIISFVDGYSTTKVINKIKEDEA